MHGIIFFDGASKGNPGRGGWGVAVVHESQVNELGGYAAYVTNNRMELTAAVEALRFAVHEGMKQIDIYGDSKYIIDNITKSVPKWEKNGWKTVVGKPVLNRDLWEELSELSYRSDAVVSWHYVSGHVHIPGNERVDAIASGFALGKSVDLYNGTLDGYGIDITNLAFDKNLQEVKSTSRARSKLPAFSYVSEVGGIVQVHATWAVCEARIKGKKARFKKTLSRDEEKKIIAEFSQPKK